MAVRLVAYEVADLCLGKPPLRSLSSSATVADALAAIKSSDDNSISVWSCDHSKTRNLECVCVGKVCMVDIICFLCREENLSSPALALKAPVSVLLSKVNGGLVRHVEPSSSLLEAIDLLLQGAQNLVVPIKSSNTKRKQLQKPSICPTIHNGQQFCWLTQEDVIRFLLSSIGLFSSIAALSIDTLGIISTGFLAVEYHSPPYRLLRQFHVPHRSNFVGRDLMAYIDCGGPPEELVRVVESRLKQRNLDGMLKEFMMIINSSNGELSNSSSSDDELPSPPRHCPGRGVIIGRAVGWGGLRRRLCATGEVHWWR
ncbi:hypothetical protein DH2020_008579 [Rehmannia glutinosa]|uniref:CBS domain-containing protein n=1 Tax=Rehmannia glutinosa TaxID=99300 RepID=A0ABR0X545_REHGL